MLQGTLDSVGLENLLQILLREGRPPGLLTISRGTERRTLFVESSGLRLCAVGPEGETLKRTEETLADLVHWRRASFEFSNVDRRADGPDAFLTPTRVTQVLLDAVRHSDATMAAFRRTFPKLDAIPVLTRRWNPRLPPTDPSGDLRAIAGLIDGRRTVEGVCEESPRSLVRTMRVLHLLHGSGHVSVKPPRPPAAAPAPEPAPDTRVVWKRMLGKTCLVVLADPTMTRAFLQVRGDRPSTPSIIDALRGSGLRLVADLARSLDGGPAQNVLVAEGQAPRPGHAAEIRWAVDWNAEAAQVKFIDDRAQFHEIHTILQVKPDEVIGELLPAEKGADGIDVFGRPIPARAVSNPVVRPGAHVELDGTVYRAKMFGRLRRDDSRVWVEPLFKVNGDLDFHTGNVRFAGDVVIAGNVLDGFEVDATGTITVFGSIFASSLRAGRDIVVREGVNGHGKGRLTAGGSVTARYLNAVEVRAGGDVKIYNEILHSTVRAGGRVRIPAGAIVGGSVCGRLGVEAATAGSPMRVMTRVAAGVGPEAEEEARNLAVRSQMLFDRMAQLHPLVRPFVNRPDALSALPEPQRGDMAARVREFERLLSERGEVERRQGEIFAAAVDERDLRLRFLHRLYSHVTIAIGRLTTTTDADQEGPITMAAGEGRRLVAV